MKVWLNGRLCDDSDAKVSVLDHGFLYGDGVYETVRIRRTRALFLTEHLTRLKRSCRLIHLSLPWAIGMLAGCVRKTLSANGWGEAALRIQVSRGVGPLGFDTKGCKPTLVIVERPLEVYPSAYYEKGVTAALVATRRNHPWCLPPQAKSTNCLNGILAKWEASRSGAFEGILLNLSGQVAEGTVSNVFMVRGGLLLTPALGCGLLPGVTRAVILRLARQAGLTVRETTLKAGDLARAAEIFLTNSLFDVMPVTQLKMPVSRRVGDGRVGPVTRLLMDRYRRYLENL